MKKTIAAGALVISLFVVGCGGDKATPVPATDVPAAVESMAAEAVESMAAEVEDAVESMAAEASPAA